MLIEARPVVDVERAQGVARLHYLHLATEVAVVCCKVEVVAREVYNLIFYVCYVCCRLPLHCTVDDECVERELVALVLERTLIYPVLAATIV